MIPGGLPADYMYQISLCSTTDQKNQTILGSVMIGICGDYEVFHFCAIIEHLCDDPAAATFFKLLQNGMNL